MNKALLLTALTIVSTASVHCQAGWMDTIKGSLAVAGQSASTAMNEMATFTKENPKAAAALATAAVVGSVVAAKVRKPAATFARNNWKALTLLTVGAVSGVAAYKNFDAKAVQTAAQEGFKSVTSAIAQVAQNVGTSVSTTAAELWKKYVTRK